MATSTLKTSTILFSKIQVSPLRLRVKNIAAQRKAMQAIRRSGQQRPLIIDPNGQLGATAASCAKRPHKTAASGRQICFQPPFCRRQGVPNWITKLSAFWCGCGCAAIAEI